jgi:hypothetical protein
LGASVEELQKLYNYFVNPTGKEEAEALFPKKIK